MEKICRSKCRYKLFSRVRQYKCLLGVCQVKQIQVLEIDVSPSPKYQKILGGHACINHLEIALESVENDWTLINAVESPH